MDFLSPILSRLTLSARVFYSGHLCRSVSFHERPGVSYLHVLKSGSLIASHREGEPTEISEPSLLFYPQPHFHEFRMRDTQGADLVCAAIDFGAGEGNPLLRSLPSFLVAPLNRIAGAAPTVQLLFDEAFNSRSGRSAAVDRLAEYFVVLVVRYALETKLMKAGVFAALADSKLGKAVQALHEKPEYDWSLEELARTCDMSRARFAAHFRDVVGTTPMDYLADWRIGIAQALLKKGKPLKIVAPMIGYSSAQAFTRIFSKRVGMPPAKWLSDVSVEEPLAQSPYVDAT